MPIIVKPGPKDKEVNWKEEHPWEAAETDTIPAAHASGHDDKPHAALPDSTAGRKHGNAEAEHEMTIK